MASSTVFLLHVLCLYIHVSSYPLSFVFFAACKAQVPLSSGGTAHIYVSATVL